MTSLLHASKRYRTQVKRMGLRIPKRMLRSDILHMNKFCVAMGCVCNITGVDTMLSFQYFHGQEKSVERVRTKLQL
jgi:hypothetical protein